MLNLNQIQQMITKSIELLITYLSKYWHLGLIFALVCISRTEFQKLRFCNIKIVNSENVKLYLAPSKAAFIHTPQNELPKIEFDSFHLIKNDENIFQNHWSAWYKIKFDTLPENFTLDFYNFETVVGSDANSKFIFDHCVETSTRIKNHNRHVFFDLQKTNTTQIFFFKVFALTQQKSDSLEIRFTPTKNFKNIINAEFYESQVFMYCIFIAIGAIFFQMIYIIGLVWSRRKLEYVYYFLYGIVGIVYLFMAHRFELGYLGYSKILITSSILTYLALFVFFYFRFVRYYLNTKTFHPFLDSQIKNAEISLLLGTIINFSIFYFTQDLEATFSFFIPFTTFIIILNFYIAGLLYLVKSPLIKYLMFGYTLTVVLMILRLVLLNLQSIGWISDTYDFDGIIFIFGVLIDSICLNLGLNYKHRLENIENHNALLNERKEITYDLHDDLGSGLSNIKLLSDRARRNLNIVESKIQVEKIYLQTSELIENLSVIVWSLDSRYDKLSNLIEQMKDYSATLSDIQTLHWEIPTMKQSTLNLELSPEFKKNIYLIFKESINNAVKYANSEVIKVVLDVKNEQFIMYIQDFGEGFDKKAITHNFGLNSIESRTKILGGNVEIISKINEGTLVKIVVNLSR